MSDHPLCRQNDVTRSGPPAGTSDMFRLLFGRAEELGFLATISYRN